MEFGEMKQNTSNWSNFCMLLRRAGLTASAGLSCWIQIQACKKKIGSCRWELWWVWGWNRSIHVHCYIDRVCRQSSP